MENLWLNILVLIHVSLATNLKSVNASLVGVDMFCLVQNASLICPATRTVFLVHFNPTKMEQITVSSVVCRTVDPVSMENVLNVMMDTILSMEHVQFVLRIVKLVLKIRSAKFAQEDMFFLTNFQIVHLKLFKHVLHAARTATLVFSQKLLALLVIKTVNW